MGIKLTTMTWLTAERAATIAAIASALAAFAALGVSCSQSRVPFEAALYQARWQSSADFSFAMSQFYDRYDRVRIDMPDWVKDPGSYAAKTDNDYMEAARKARPILQAIGDFSAQVSKAATPWSKGTVVKISAVLSEGERLTDCFQKFATFTSLEDAPANWMSQMRALLPNECEGSLENTNLTKIQELARTASQAMLVEAQRRVDFDDMDELANGTATAD
ncbi:MAG: hypothetical protein J0J06_07845 [Sphingomonas sp.]|uniref:hypothetical protein n=1 Tax=Sphingomonas sp. TaxID=28214 RepID=UPI001AC83885|nr:hypothetical protein [Sphingomonas sp.]MBN8815342.1 hypothetical protein [Sphingomonas sp.]